MAGKKDAIGNKQKPRLSLIPKSALWELGGALTYGEDHYGTHNWRQGIKVSYLLDAAIRHIFQFSEGEDIDGPSQNNHLGNAMANLAMAIEMVKNKPEFDDRFKPSDEMQLRLDDFNKKFNDLKSVPYANKNRC